MLCSYVVIRFEVSEQITDLREQLSDTLELHPSTYFESEQRKC